PPSRTSLVNGGKRKKKTERSCNRAKEPAIKYRPPPPNPDPAVGVVRRLGRRHVSCSRRGCGNRGDARPHGRATSLAKSRLSGILGAALRTKYYVFGHIPDYTTPATGLQTEFAAR